MFIQIVEDDTALRNGIVLALSDGEVRFLQDGDVRSAMESFLKQEPGLIILDVNLPDARGYEYLKW